MMEAMQRESFLDESRRKLLQLRREVGSGDPGEAQAVTRALGKIRSGDYGRCEDCQGEISPARLEVMPTARFCKSCAREAEEARAASEPKTPAAPPPVAADYEGMSDEELRDAVLEEIQAAGEGFEGVDVVVEAGSVRLEGVVPTEQHRELVLEAVRDRIGIEPRHRLRIDRLAFESKGTITPEPLPGDQPEVQRARKVEEETENVFDAEEKGIGFSPPAKPVPPPRKS